MRFEENLSWCQPRETKNGLWFTLCEGKIVSIKDGDELIYNATPEQIKGYAEQEKIYPDLYDWYTPEETLINYSEERSCCECPFFEECDAMERPQKDMIYNDPEGKWKILDIKAEGVEIENTETGSISIVPYTEVLYFINFRQ